MKRREAKNHHCTANPRLVDEAVTRFTYGHSEPELFAGLMTNANAQVLRGCPIAGLYALGNVGCKLRKALQTFHSEGRGNVIVTFELAPTGLLR